ncbi:MAG TPA: hypothetical protein VF131_03920 [Blastocatellia bacterium]|nr:hypothetical protein [Blastocatellia bacterium]
MLINKLRVFSRFSSFSGVLLFSFVFMAADTISGTSTQSSYTDPGHKEYVEVGDVRFSCPKYFSLQQKQTNNQIAYMRHDKYDLGLIVAVADQSIDDEYINRIAALVSSHLFPKESSPYSWKRMEEYQKVSKFEVGGGMVQGFNGHQRIFLQYRILKSKGKEVVVGYGFGMGTGKEAGILFERNLGGDSMPGWYAQAHIIASITGEKYEQINPPGSRIAAPPPPGKN